MPKDKILFFNDYQDDPFPIIGTPRAEYHQWLRGIYKVWMGKDTPDIPEVRASSVKAIVNAGRWLWICLACNSAIPVELGQPSICPQCGWQGWVDVALPRNRKAIENELLKQPGHRSRTAIREWKPGWPMGHLQIRTKKAQAALAAGTINVSSLSVAATRLFAVSEVLTAANMNTHISNPIDDLVGRLRNDNTGGDPVEFENAIVIDSLTTTERNALTATNGMLIYNSTLNVFQRYENGAWVDHTHANTLTLASGAQGDALFLNSSGTVARLAVGTDRQVFRTQGASANPIWDDLEDIRVAGTTARGEIVFIGSNGRLNRLAAGANRQALRTHGSDADPTFADLEDIRVAGTTARGEIVFIGSNSRLNRLAAGTDRQALRTQGVNADPTFADLEDLRIAATTARGDVFYVGSNGRLNRLAAGTSNFFFQTKGSTADPVWASASATVVFVRLTTGTSWTVPTGVNAVYVEVIGGGGGGTISNSPGEGGLTARHFFLASSLGTTVTYAIGAGGGAGNAGGNTVFAGHAVGLGGRTAVSATGATRIYDRVVATGQKGANGGRGGSSGGAGSAGGTGLPTTVGGGTGGTAGTGSGAGGAGGAGTNSLNGLGSGGGGGGGGGSSGGNGGAGGAGGIPGGGGGGGGGRPPTANSGAGGAGARGEIRIWYW